jgi:hypothetical protein
VDQLLCEIQDYARQHLKLTSDQMKTCYNPLALYVVYQEGNQVRLYHPTHTKGKVSQASTLM